MEDVVAMVSHALSFDVENWYDASLIQPWARSIPEDDRVVEEVVRSLDLLEAHGVKATFFFLGRVACKHPELVKRVSARGHEVGCHGLNHDLYRDCRPEQLRDELCRTRLVLQDLSGQPILGHRAPSWSLDRRVPWAVEAILDAGFAYDSSVFPMRTWLYGDATLPNRPFWLRTPSGRRLLELPPALYRLGPLAIPFGGGLYWRVLPYRAIHALLAASRQDMVTYLHPWELNPAPYPRNLRLPRMARWLSRIGLGRTRSKLERLLSRFAFGPLAEAASRWRENDGLPTISLTGD